jgi:mRNA interferase RelE/StbE
MPKSGGNKRVWQVEYHPKAEKEIHQLHSPIAERIRRAIERLQQNPYIGKSLAGRLQGHRSWRVGDYRIVYLIEDAPKQLFVLHVGSRGSAYPKTARRKST